MKLSTRVLTVLGLFMAASLVQTAAAGDCAFPDGNCPEAHAAARQQRQKQHQHQHQRQRQ